MRARARRPGGGSGVQAKVLEAQRLAKRLMSRAEDTDTHRMGVDPIVQCFFEEAAELLSDFEACLLRLEETPGDAELLNRIFRSAHTLKGNSGMLGFDEIAHFTHGLEDLLGALREGRRVVTPRVVDTLLASKDTVRSLLAHAQDSSAGQPEAAEIERVLAALRAHLNGEDEPALREPAPADTEERTPSEVEGAAEHDAEAGSAAQPAQEERRAGTTAAAEAVSIRVPIEKVDRLINLVGELVITQSMVAQTVSAFTPEKLARLEEAVVQMNRHARELHERMMGIRMLPLKTLFARFPRLVRDLAATSGKQVVLDVSGEETELDKNVIEKIGDPLTHLIRNAVDHGLESPATREAAGKPEVGHVRLQAYQQGGSIYIEVADDGRGIDRERIVAKAIEHGLVAPDQTLTADEAFALVFRPGISTAEKVTEISGRGVGMDVVKRNVGSLGGSITIRSETGKGTRFRIKLPLTLAIMDGQALEVGGEVYLLPLVAITESVRPTADSLHAVAEGAEVVMVRGRALPLIRLARLLGTQPRTEDPTKGLVVIVEHEGRLAALLVDELLGQQQVVIKSLETNFKKMDGIAGATILGDGRVALILDVPGLVALARPADPHRTATATEMAAA